MVVAVVVGNAFDTCARIVRRVSIKMAVLVAALEHERRVVDVAQTLALHEGRLTEDSSVIRSTVLTHHKRKLLRVAQDKVRHRHIDIHLLIMPVQFLDGLRVSISIYRNLRVHHSKRHPSNRLVAVAVFVDMQGIEPARQ